MSKKPKKPIRYTRLHDDGSIASAQRTIEKKLKLPAGSVRLITRAVGRRERIPPAAHSSSAGIETTGSRRLFRQVTATTHDGVTFDFPEEWLGRCELPPGGRQFVSEPQQRSSNSSKSLRRRSAGVRWFDERRTLRILEGIAAGHVLPPVDVDRPPAGPLPFRMRDGFHRYYASVALGFEMIPTPRWTPKTGH